MELYHLRSFVAVADDRQLTRASERLHLSQPAVSAHIKSLEEELGVRLFDRTPRGMRLTEAGALLKKQAEIALGTVETLQDQARRVAGNAHDTFRLGLPMDVRLLHISALLSTMADKHPFMAFQFHQRMSWHILDHIRAGKLDGGYNFIGGGGDDLASVALRTSGVRIVGPVQWKDRVANADWHGIARLPWIWAPDDCPFHRILSEIFQEKALKPFKVAVADQQASHHALVAAGVGLTLMTAEEALFAEENGQIVVWGEAIGSIVLYFTYLKRREDDPAIRSVLEVVRKIWDQRTG